MHFLYLFIDLVGYFVSSTLFSTFLLPLFALVIILLSFSVIINIVKGSK